jgi:hypothetical protein
MPRVSWLGVVVAIGLSACDASSRSNAGLTGAAGTGAVVVPACGGDLEGHWEGFDDHVPEAGDRLPADPCHRLKLSLEQDGTYAASSFWPIPERREAELRFDGENFSWLTVLRGLVAQTFGASCLATVAPPPTCAQLGAALKYSGVGEGSYFDIACTPASGGACACTAMVIEASGPAGTFSVAAGRLSLAPYVGGMPDKTVEGPYCVQNGVLRLDRGFDAAAKGISRITFSSVSAQR